MRSDALALKLKELEEKINLLHTAIASASLSQDLDIEIEKLRKEYESYAECLDNKMRLSRSDDIKRLYESYKRIIALIRESEDAFEKTGKERNEKKILLAEYALDYAIEASERALLLSLEAIKIDSSQI